jgi:hypothetical protein
MAGGHAGPDPVEVWRSVFEPDVIDWWRENPGASEAEFDQWLREQVPLIVQRCGPLLEQRELLGVSETGAVLTAMQRDAVDGLHAAAHVVMARPPWRRGRQQG